MLYEGSCPSAAPPSNWSVYSWKGDRSPPPVPHLAASGGAPPLAACAHCNGYTVSCAHPVICNQTGLAAVSGCYARVNDTLFRRAATSSTDGTGRGVLELYRSSSTGHWAIVDGVAATHYVSNCNSSTLPPANHGWHTVSRSEILRYRGANSQPLPLSFSATIAFPLGYCAPVPPPPHRPHPNCVTPECTALWGPSGCPDLLGVPADLLRPPMDKTGAAPAAGLRARAVAPGFEGTEAYHPLYLPREWEPPAEAPSSAGQLGRRPQQKLYPVIVECVRPRPLLLLSGTLL